jgi:hypothetical protein
LSVLPITQWLRYASSSHPSTMHSCCQLTEERREWVLRRLPACWQLQPQRRQAGLKPRLQPRQRGRGASAKHAAAAAAKGAAGRPTASGSSTCFQCWCSMLQPHQQRQV